MLKWIKHWPSHFLWPAVVLASIVHLLTSLRVPLELPAALLASRVSMNYVRPANANSHDEREQLAVVTISQTEFDGRYEGTSPLNRCRLAEDLGKLLDGSNLRTVAVDLFLSPSVSERTRDSSRNGQPDECRLKLEQVLDKSSKKLILVFEPEPGPTPRPTSEDVVWSKRFPGLTLTHPSFETTFGIVMNHWVYPDSVGLGSALSGRLCLVADAPEFCRRYQRDGGYEGDGELMHHKHSINYGEVKYLYNNGIPLSVADAVTAIKGGKVRHVLFGAAYGSDDRHRTPVGPKYGVEIHAAIAAQPRAHDAHWPGFLLDIVMGAFFFGPLVQLMWRRYFEQRLGRVNVGSRWRTVGCCRFNRHRPKLLEPSRTLSD